MGLKLALIPLRKLRAVSVTVTFLVVVADNKPGSALGLAWIHPAPELLSRLSDSFSGALLTVSSEAVGGAVFFRVVVELGTMLATLVQVDSGSIYTCLAMFSIFASLP